MLLGIDQPGTFWDVPCFFFPIKTTSHWQLSTFKTNYGCPDWSSTESNHSHFSKLIHSIVSEKSCLLSSSRHIENDMLYSHPYYIMVTNWESFTIPRGTEDLALLSSTEALLGQVRGAGAWEKENIKNIPSSPARLTFSLQGPYPHASAPTKPLWRRETWPLVAY